MSADHKSSVGKDSAGKHQTETATTLPLVIEKEGMIFKRGARMQRWSARYFVLEGHKLCYKAKKETPTFKYEYELVDGTVVTDIVPDVGSSGGKLYTFWVVWPGAKDHHKDGKEHPDLPAVPATASNSSGDYEALMNASNTSVNTNNSSSNNSQNMSLSTPANVTSSSDRLSNLHPPSSSSSHSLGLLRDQAVKDQSSLKTIVEAERKNRLDVQDKVEQQIEAHHAYDNNTALGVKIAAAAVGGVVVGALTAGIGLIPYVTVVGVTALVSGGAVAAQSARRPLDSRIILATETLSEALSWKSAIEMQIAKVVEAKRPSLPFMHNVGYSGNHRGLTQEQMHQFHQNGYWRNIGYLPGGMRVQEHVASAKARASNAPHIICFKSQMVIPDTPIKTFLALMDLNSSSNMGTEAEKEKVNPLMWPPRSNRTIPGKDGESATSENFCKLVEVLDDHADIIAVSLRVKSASDTVASPCCPIPGAVGSTLTGLDMPEDAEERSYDYVPQLIERTPLYLNTAEPTGLHQDFDREGNVEWDGLKTTYVEQFQLLAAPFQTYQSREFWGRVRKELCRHLLKKIADNSPSTKYPLRQFCLHRFWKLDDDGTYLITCTLTAHPEFPTPPPAPPVTATGTFDPPLSQQQQGTPVLPISVDTVITISPRKDADLYSEDINECLVTCSIQASAPEESTVGKGSGSDGSTTRLSGAKSEGAQHGNMKGGNWVDRTECESFMLEYLYQLIDLKHHIMYTKHRNAMRESNSRVARNNSFDTVQGSSQDMYQYTTPSKNRSVDSNCQLESPQSIGSSIMNSVPGTPAAHGQRGRTGSGSGHGSSYGNSNVNANINGMVTPMKSKNRFAGSGITTQQPGLDDDDDLSGIAFSPPPNTTTGATVTADALNVRRDSQSNNSIVSHSSAVQEKDGSPAASSSSHSRIFGFRSKKSKEAERERRERSGSNMSTTTLGSADGTVAGSSEGGSSASMGMGQRRQSEYGSGVPPVLAAPDLLPPIGFVSPQGSGRARASSIAARRRSSVLKRANPELLTLRNSIQGKEYEIHRIEKMLRKLSDQPPQAKSQVAAQAAALAAAGDGSTPMDEKTSLRQFLIEQCREYHELTVQYFHASQGEVYKPKSSVGKKLVKRGIVAPVVPASIGLVSAGGGGDNGSSTADGLGIDAADLATLSGTGLSSVNSATAAVGGTAATAAVAAAVQSKTGHRWRNWFGGKDSSTAGVSLPAAQLSSSSIDTLGSADHPSSAGLYPRDNGYAHGNLSSSGLVLTTSADNLSILGAAHNSLTEEDDFDDDNASMAASTIIPYDPFFDRVPKCSRSLPKHWNHPLVVTHRTMLEAVQFHNSVQVDATSAIIVAFFGLLTMWAVIAVQQMEL